MQSMETSSTSSSSSTRSSSGCAAGASSSATGGAITGSGMAAPLQRRSVARNVTLSATLPSPPATTHAEVAHVALALFARDGFEATTVDDVAAALGVGRRTLFRYYASKNDMVWGEFDGVMAALREHLEAAGDAPPLRALRQAIVASNRYAAGELPTLRIRMRLIGSVPALQGHSLRRYEEWRRIVTEYAAARRGVAPGDLTPQLIGHAALGTTMAAFQWWVEHGEGAPADVIDRALASLAGGFG